MANTNTTTSPTPLTIGEIVTYSRKYLGGIFSGPEYFVIDTYGKRGNHTCAIISTDRNADPKRGTAVVMTDLVRTR